MESPENRRDFPRFVDTDQMNAPRRHVMLMLPVMINLKRLSVGTGKNRQTSLLRALLARSAPGLQHQPCIPGGGSFQPDTLLLDM